MMYSYRNKEGENMSISYEPLWQMLNELNITKMEFARMIDISNATLAKIGKNEPITLTTVDKICNYFNCKIENVVKHIPEISIKTPNFLVKTGMIIQALDIGSVKDLTEIHINAPDGTVSTTYRPKKGAFVILDIVSGDLDNDPENIANTKYEDLSYIIAPISMISDPSLLNVEFSDAIINGEKTSGYVLFGKMKRVNASLFEKVVGQMSDSYIKKFEKILYNLVNAITDIDS